MIIYTNGAWQQPEKYIVLSCMSPDLKKQIYHAEFTLCTKLLNLDIMMCNLTTFCFATGN